MYLLLNLIPIVWFLVARIVFKQTITFKEIGAALVSILLINLLVFEVSKYGQTADFEIWNGQITGKEREHGQYVESYSCNCRSVTHGSGNDQYTTEECDTCYRDHYTVTWTAQSTIGNIQLDHEDSLSRSVYRMADPAVYTNCQIGEPASRESSYVNYVRAAADSLFSFDNINESYYDMVPPYPRVYGKYHINRILTVGDISFPVQEYDKKLDEILIDIGPQKQGNIIIILTDILSRDFRYAVEEKWMGAKKNDIVLLMGLKNNEILWTEIIAWSNNKLFDVTLRDKIQALETIEDFDLVIETLDKTTMQYYERKPMAEFEYLKDEIKPPFWLTIFMLIANIGACITATVIFHREDLFNNYY